MNNNREVIDLVEVSSEDEAPQPQLPDPLIANPWLPARLINRPIRNYWTVDNTPNVLRFTTHPRNSTVELQDIPFGVRLHQEPFNMARPAKYWKYNHLVKRFTHNCFNLPHVEKNKKKFKEAFVDELYAYNSVHPCFLPMYPTYPVYLDISLHRPLPLDAFIGKDRRNGFTGNPERWLEGHTHTPDIDNMAKFYLDALQNIIYKDDKQVVRLNIVKCWHTRPPYTGMTQITWRMANKWDLPHDYDGRPEFPVESDLPEMI